MKKLIPLFVMLAILSFTSGCKKAIEDKKEDIVIDAITNGVWRVEQYLEGANNISTDFADYDFQFFKDGSVTSTKAGNTVSGTWSGNAVSYTITSNFPSATDPILKMNGAWKLTDSYWDYVEAEMTTGSGMNKLHLRKKP